MRARVLLGVVLTVGCLGAPGVAHAGAWSAPAILGGVDVTADAPEVTMDASGAAVATWLAGGGALLASAREPGGRFGPAQLLTVNGAADPHVALDGSGRALVVWAQAGAVVAAERRPGASFAGVGALATGRRPDVAYAGAGEAIVTYEGADGQVHAVSRAPSGSLGPVQTVSAEAGAKVPRVAAAGGHALVAWVATETAGGTTTTRVSTASRSPGGAFTAPQLVDAATFSEPAGGPTGATLSVPKPVVSPTGHADLLVSRLEAITSIPGERIHDMRVWTRPAGAGSAWSATRARQFGGVPFDPATGDVAAGRSGDAAFAGASWTGLAFAVRTLVRLPGASDFADGASAFTGRATARSGLEGLIAALSGGRFVVAARTSADLLATAGRPASGFDPAVTVSAGGVGRMIGLAAGTREAVVAWLDTASGAGRLAVALYDDLAAPTAAPRRSAGRDTQAPVLSRLAVSPKRFASRRVARGRARSPRGTRIRWRLSEPARVTFRVDRVRPGFRRGSRCVAARPRRGTVRRCTRHVPAGSLVRTSAAGNRTLRFRGVLRRRPLAAGAYRLSAQARDAAGNRSRVRRAQFTVRAR